MEYCKMEMNLAINTEFTNEMHQDILDFVKYTILTESSETERFILKFHLLLEALFEKVIKKSFIYPKPILESELTFSQKHAIVKSICYQDDISIVFKDIHILNKIRNEFSHNLESKRYEKLIKSLSLGGRYEIDKGYELNAESLKLFKERNYQLYGTLLGIYDRLENRS